MIFGMKKPFLAVRPYRHSRTHKFILDLRPWGKRRLFFKTRAEADAECLRQKTLLERHSREAVGLTPREMSDFITARNKLAEYSKTITDAAEFLIDHEERIRRCKTTVSQLAAEVVEAKRRDGRSLQYIDDLELRLSHFSRDFGDRLIATITTKELNHWLRGLPLGPHSRTNYRRNIGVMFSHAVDNGMLESNPIARTAKPKLPDTPPEIFTVDELRALLEAAQRIEPNVVPMLAIGAFAGLRDAEIKRLHWNEIDLVRGFVDVKAAKAKSARRRVVKMLPNLAAWLRNYSGMAGNVAPKGARGKLARVRREAGQRKWPKNGLRHSFASYRLEATQDAPRVAHELGHTNPQLLYNTYREIVTPDDAEKYWQITPATEAVNVVEFANEAQA
jgi:integrase